MNSDMPARFDGMAIYEYGGRFSGQFDLDASYAQNHTLGSQGYALVRWVMDGASVRTTKAGDLRRVNVYEVAGLTPLDPQIGLQLQTTGYAQIALDVDIPEGEDDL